MDVMSVATFAAGLVLLIGGAEALVRGAVRLAAAVGVSSLVIGLTVVAFGTSAPELAVGVQAGLAGRPDIVLGNVVGSNICNVLLILGLSALITPLRVSQQLVRLDVPLMIGVSFAMLLLALDGRIGRMDGLLLFAGIVVYTVWSIRESRRENRLQEDYAEEFGVSENRSPIRWVMDIGLILVGFVLLRFGSRWLVEGAVHMAEMWGVNQLVIGLTVVALGTSLPELATSVVASIHGARDLAVGNVVGSNIFNILSVLGLTSLVSPSGVRVSSAALKFDIPVMIAVAVACLPVFFTGNIIARWEGGLFLGYYIAYIVYLVLDAINHAALAAFSAVMMTFVIPLTVITFMILIVRTVRQRRRGE